MTYLMLILFKVRFIAEKVAPCGPKTINRIHHGITMLNNINGLAKQLAILTLNVIICLILQHTVILSKYSFFQTSDLH